LQRTGAPLRPEAVTKPLPPEGIDLSDGLSKTEAVAIALWNNPQLQADLASLGFARAELAQAGVLQNPFLSLFFPLGPKQLEFTLTWPVQDLWLRPRRVAVARLNAETVADSLVEGGLNLAESVKIAYANLARLRRQARLAEEASNAERDLADVADARLRAGDLSELEAAAFRTRALRSLDQARRLAHQETAAAESLIALLGITPDVLPAPFAIDEEPLEPDETEDAASLVQMALAARPDVRAAELAIEHAGKRLGLEKSSYWKISAIVDANGEGTEGFEMGPGIWAEIPAFNRNQGGVGMAEAELESAVHGYAAVRNRIATEVRDAYAKRVELAESLRVWREDIVPTLEVTLTSTERSFEAGDLSYADLLNARLTYLDGRRQLADLEYDFSQSTARLENAVGQNLEALQ
jgi:cobalt-zinc-cadmium efflux system outer membrane protein